MTAMTDAPKLPEPQVISELRVYATDPEACMSHAPYVPLSQQTLRKIVHAYDALASTAIEENVRLRDEVERLKQHAAKYLNPLVCNDAGRKDVEDTVDNLLARHGDSHSAIKAYPGTWLSIQNALASFRLNLNAANERASAAETRAAALGKDGERLDFVLAAGAFIDSGKSDAGVTVYQLLNQDEDENFHAISGENKFFANTRAAIDSAMDNSKSQEPKAR